MHGLSMRGHFGWRPSLSFEGALLFEMPGQGDAVDPFLGCRFENWLRWLPQLSVFDSLGIGGAFANVSLVGVAFCALM